MLPVIKNMKVYKYFQHPSWLVVGWIGALLLVITFVFSFVVPSNTLLAEEQIVVFEIKGMSCGFLYK